MRYSINNLISIILKSIFFSFQKNLKFIFPAVIVQLFELVIIIILSVYIFIFAAANGGNMTKTSLNISFMICYNSYFYSELNIYYKQLKKEIERESTANDNL